MREFYKIMAWSIGILGILFLGLIKACKNSIAEDNSRESVSQSSKMAKEFEVFVRPVAVAPAAFAWRGKIVPIEDVWIERESQVHYTLLFFKNYEFFNEYKLVVVPYNVPETETSDMTLVVDGDHFFEEHNHGVRVPYELVYDLGSHIPEIIKAAVRDGDVPIDTLIFRVGNL